jgi:hypothetical protein
MLHNKTKDLRGPQRRIARLIPFHLEGFIHVLAYRILVPLMILWGLLIIAYLTAPALGPAVVWVLWTPQLYEVAKGLALAWSRGMAFGKLNEEFAHLYRKRYRARTGLRVLPLFFLVVWLVGFVIMLVGWQP